MLEFGSTGKLRHSGLVMYDRTTESWWQQFLGQGDRRRADRHGNRNAAGAAGVVRRASGSGRRKAGCRSPPSDARAYGTNPYVGYDSAPAPFLYQGMLPKELAPLARVVRVGDEAWSLDLVRQKAPFEVGDLRFTWEPGQASALDTGTIADGKDVGNALVERRTADGWEDAVYSVDFAFAFHAFFPDGVIHVR